MFTESLTATRCSTLFLSSYFTLSRFLEVGTIIIPLYKWRLREVTWALATQLVKNRSRAQAWVLCTCHKILTSILHFFMVVAKKKKGGGKTSGLAVRGAQGTLFPTKQLFKKILNINHLKSLEVVLRAYRKWKKHSLKIYLTLVRTGTSMAFEPRPIPSLPLSFISWKLLQALYSGQVWSVTQGLLLFPALSLGTNLPLEGQEVSVSHPLF